MRIAAFLAMAALAGCSRNDKSATHEPVSITTVTSLPLTLTTPAGDEELDRQLTTMLEQLPLRRFSLPEGDERTRFHVEMALIFHSDVVEELRGIDVQVQGGVVTLRGTTSTRAVRTSIERIVSQQPGVVSIEDRLRVAKPRP